MADPGEGPGKPGSPPYFSTKRGSEWPKNIFLETGPTPYLRVWMTAPPHHPPYLKVWIRHCVLWIPACCSNKQGQNNNDPARLSQCIKKLLRLFLEIGNCKCSSCKKAKAIAKVRFTWSTNKNTIKMIILYSPLWPVGCNQTVDQRTWSITLSCRLMQLEILFAIFFSILVYFIIIRYSSLIL